jgi:ADP-ribose pyrophosphatase YjhB (NUDIX family)
VVGVGGVVIREGRALLICRGHEPYKGTWSIPGGKLEVGETIPQAVRREMKEETGLDVEVGELIEALERIERDADGRVRFHYLILDYRCNARAAQPAAGGDALNAAFVAEDELKNYDLSEDVQRVVGKAFAMWREGR